MSKDRPSIIQHDSRLPQCGLGAFRRTTERLIDIFLDAGGTTRYDAPAVLAPLRDRLDDLAELIDAEPGLLTKRFSELDRGQTGALLPRDGSDQMLQWELWRAARNNEFDKVKLLVEHGPDVNQPTTRHNRSPYQEARLAGHDQIADYLTEHGARQIELEEKERFESACNASRREQALAILQKSPRLLEELGEQRRSEIVHSAASSGRGEAVRFVAELRFDLNAKVSKRTPMHDAAWRNDVVTIKLLLEFGADPAMQDGAYGGTPLG